VTVPPPTAPPPQPKTAKVKKAPVDTPPAACAERDKQLAELFAPYVDAFSNRGIEVSPDGQTLLFLSNRGGGTMQLFVAPVDKPGAEPTPIAPAKDAVYDARFTPDGLYVLFTRDKDRNENTQIYRASVDGKQVVPLTKAPERFHQLPRVTADWKTMVYLRGLHRTGGGVLVSQPLEGGEAKPVMKVKGFHELADISPDGKQALVYAILSLSRSQLLAVDLKSGQAKQLAPKAPDAQANVSAYSADGKSIYVITDEGSERAGLRRLDAKSGAAQGTFVDPQAEVADVRVSRKLPLVAVLLDHGSHRSLKLLDGETLKEKTKVKLPMGGASLGEFDASGTGLVVNVSLPGSPSEIFLVNAASGKLKPLRREKRPGLRKLVPIVASVQQVSTFDALKVPCNVYLPKKLPRGKKLPVIVSVHGGPAGSSSIRWSPQVSFWISRGFVVVEPNVRGSTGFGKAYERADNGRKRMDAVKDLGAVNAWVRQQPWADPERLVVFGGSYGGYMTYMALGHQPTLWRAGIGLVGVVNLVSFLRSTTGAIRMAFVEEFGKLPEDAAFLEEVSPLTAVKQVRAPVFVYQGENDPRVPRSEQDQLVRALRRAKVPVEYMVAADEGHSADQRHNKLELFSRSLRFLEQHLGLPGLPEGCSAGAAKADASGGAADKPAKGAADKPAKGAADKPAKGAADKPAKGPAEKAAPKK